MDADQARRSISEEALKMHASGKPGKLEVNATKPLLTQRDLALAYSPGVGAPCLKIADNPDDAYLYTAKGNMVAVISNGTAVLGFGDIGAQASKPVMEGKAVLFKRFADVDSFDLEIDTKDVDEFVNAVRYLGPSFGGINLEDIKAPECFIIEQRLKELMDIPIFHDDQHGTAIVAAAGLINALHLTGRDIKDTKVVVNGAGAASIACIELIKAMGLPHENAILCDSIGAIYQGREERMNQWKSAHAVPTQARSLADAMNGADVFLGLSVKDAVTPEMVQSMNANPIIFAMANPEPEITPDQVAAVRSDAIVATGRSDYPNQVNNVLGFPYIFRGALDVQATEINEAMKIAAAKAIAELAREEVPAEVDAAYPGVRMEFGAEYIIPVPFDPRLISRIASKVAEAAMESGVAKKPLEDVVAYQRQLNARRDPGASTVQLVFEKLHGKQKRILFAEAEEERMLRAAIAFRDADYGVPVLVGRENLIEQAAANAGITDLSGFEIHNIRTSQHNERYAQFMYEVVQREGLLYRDCQRMVNVDRNIFAACMLGMGDVDGMVTGLTRNYMQSFEEVTKVLKADKDNELFGMHVAMIPEHTLFMSDTTVHELPTAEQLVKIAKQTAAKAKELGHEPRVAFLSFSNFGNPDRDKAKRIQEAVKLMDAEKVDFEYEGEMSADVALDPELMRLYPFQRLTGPANVLIMPALHTANISAHLISKLNKGHVIGPLLVGLEKPVQIVQMGAGVSDIVTAAAFAAHESINTDFFTKFVE